MTNPNGTVQNRLERRKMRTRAALIRAAQTFVAAGKFNVPVLEITQAADVGMGSFYNHFESKEQLFRAAVNEVLDDIGALLDKLTVDDEDPAETFARSFRLVGRLFRQRPNMSRVLLNTGVSCSRRNPGRTSGPDDRQRTCASSAAAVRTRHA
jgi:AcrR family transcriptional regulator